MRACHGGTPLIATEAAATDRRGFEPLARMRAMATLVLGLMGLIFVLGAMLKGRAPFMDYLEAFGEAGLIGGCADWFAVVALFRQPLGLPIPHTAILPRNQDRIANAIGAFVVANFLTPEALEEKVGQISATGMVAAWLRVDANRARLAEDLGPMLPRLLAAASDAGAPNKIGALVSRRLNDIPAAPAAAHLMAALWDLGHVRTLMDQGLAKVRAYVVAQRKILPDVMQPKAGGWRPRWLDRFLTEKAIEGLIGVLEDMERPDHPWREEVRQGYQGLIVSLAKDPEALARGEALKARVLADPVLIGWLTDQWTRLEERWTGGSEDTLAQMRQGIAYALCELLAWMEGHGAERAAVDAWARRIVVNTLLPWRMDIGAFFSETVAKWDGAVLSKKIENVVGADLQYIRINGAVVGGLVGLVIHFVARRLQLQ